MSSCDKTKKTSRCIHATITLFVAVICGVIGCGGGTTGSGDVPSVKVYGAVADQQGRPVSSGTVTDLVSGTTTSINPVGTFTISATPDDGTVSLDVTTQGVSGSIQVKDLPSSTQAVAVRVVVDSVSGIITIASVEIDPVNSGETPIKDPGGKPNKVVSQRVRGTITGISGKPAKNVTVSILGAQGSKTTGADGTFTLKAKSTSGILKLRLTYKQLQGETVIRGIPKDRPCTLRVKLSISIEAGQNPGDGSEGDAILSVAVDSVAVS